jgi:hypothetical protein
MSVSVGYGRATYRGQRFHNDKIYNPVVVTTRHTETTHQKQLVVQLFLVPEGCKLTG